MKHFLRIYSIFLIEQLQNKQTINSDELDLIIEQFENTIKELQETQQHEEQYL